MRGFKLPQKMMILVSVPLIFGLAFTAVLTVLLKKADLEIQQEQRAKALVSQAQHLTLCSIDAMLHMSGYTATHSETALNHFNESCAEATAVQKELRVLVGDNIEDQQNLNKIDASIAELMQILRETKEATDNPQGSRDYITGLRVYNLVQKNRSKLRKELNQFTASARLREESNKADARSAIDAVLIGGTLLNILLTIALTLYLSKNFGSRLNILTDNALRLAAGEELIPLAKGNDEIAVLDSVFHKMAAVLAEASRKERATIENALDVICTIESSGKFTSVSAAAETVWNYAPSDLIGRRYIDILAKHEIERIREIVNSTISNQTSCSFEAEVVRQGGSIVAMLFTARWSEVENSLFCVAHDISQRREIEQLKQDFLAMVSHDLRTPLGSIQAVLTLVEEGVYGQLEERGQTRVAHAQQSMQRLISLVNNLLDLEKMESGKLTIVAEPTTLKAIISQSLEAVRAHSEQQKVTLESSYTDVELVVDNDRLVQVVINLLSNAIKFSRENTTVKISSSIKKSFVEVQISDSGRGIPANMLSKVFEKFQQVENEDSKRGRGTGLGLPICKAIIEAHGGEIGVTSQEAQGSIFWFRLPLV